jgi:hypothetical protein
MNTGQHLQVLAFLNKISNVIMLTIYNPIGTFFVCGFQLSNKKVYTKLI